MDFPFCHGDSLRCRTGKSDANSPLFCSRPEATDACEEGEVFDSVPNLAVGRKGGFFLSSWWRRSLLILKGWPAFGGVWEAAVLRWNSLWNIRRNNQCGCKFEAPGRTITTQRCRSQLFLQWRWSRSHGASWPHLAAVLIVSWAGS